MTPDLTGLVRALSGGGVQYIIVSGVAATLHGALRTTLDLDVVYARDPENVARLVRATGRGKDREALAELEALLEERDGPLHLISPPRRYRWTARFVRPSITVTLSLSRLAT